MSSNPNQSNVNQPTNQANNRNRIRGPTSALTSFLREHGIQVENRSRAQMAERRRQQREREQQAQEENATNDSAASSSSPVTTTTTETTESILYTPRRRTRNAKEKAIIEIANENKKSKGKKKRPADDDSDYSDDSDFVEPGPSSRATPGRIRVLFCSKCKCRFVRPRSDPSEETLCPDCLSGNLSKGKQPAKKRRVISHTSGGNKKPWFMMGVQSTPVVNSLQDICINIITDHISDVEALGDLSFINMDKIAKIICRNRLLTNHTARLFMQPFIRELRLYDCTNLDVDGLKNVAHFCPNLRTLRLYYCGRMTNDVLELYGSHLQQLTSLALSGCHLITEQQWIKFFKTIGSRLHSFSLRHSNRFQKDSFKALVTHCNKLQHLRLSRIVTLDDDWLEMLAESGINTLESLELSWPSTEPNRPYKLTDTPLIKVLSINGKTLKELTLRGCTDMTDKMLVDGILAHCSQLEKLELDGSDKMTSDGFKTLFSEEWKVGPLAYHHQPRMGLRHVTIARCTQFDDDALKHLLAHSGKSLLHLDIHSLHKLSVSALESIAGENTDDDNNNAYSTTKKTKSPPTSSLACTSLTYLDTSFVRSMDDYVLTKLIRSCQSLQHIKVWGCNQVTFTLHNSFFLFIDLYINILILS
ncbi:uncharacterized protein BX664DRAFT_344162 [Halteromyces radiatus]|uniref:uncharacterized protein n=1 Tax=Halteromyces radiatus TaxID=101107 RepID=UPI00221F458C|nr:uncharacterized protein BX664DRAFT_344162 [Halteromyces radiatus]KAI8076881.1 hypothetical protein BX664DRAFT_344162 [Halteromyces radiatus]